MLHHRQDVLEGEGLEVQLVGDVEVGGYGLGIRVHHDGLVARFPQSQGGGDAAVVELNSLADAVGAAPQDDHLLPVGAHRLVLPLVRGVEVRRLRGELAGAGVHRLVDGREVELPP